VDSEVVTDDSYEAANQATHVATDVAAYEATYQPTNQATHVAIDVEPHCTSLALYRGSFIEQLTAINGELNNLLKQDEFDYQLLKHGVSPFNSINEFELEETLGQGVSGIVVKAKDVRPNSVKSSRKRKFAIKRQVKETGESEKKCLERGRGLPFLTQIRGWFNDANYSYIVMDLCTGGNLRQQLDFRQGTPLPPDTILATMCEMLMGLDYLHYAKLLHRDVKPANVMFDGEGHVCISDLGLSEILSPDATHIFGAQTCLGTPNYMAAEIPEEPPPPGFPMKAHSYAIDNYAVGIMFFEMLTGVPSFANNFRALLEYELITPWQDRRNVLITISEAAHDLLCKLLAHNPARRMGSNGPGEIMEHPYFHGVSWSDVEARRNSVPNLILFEDEVQV
jgi:serine/threonine protein kinase